ncbi:MAG: 3-phosphoshikimate 1-carboxyvinyltransferase [Planctomycetes bacterium]|nr:3-phosphoshikimate 1-carboxyvinyltransferase [Planctomycetota bacterium]
MKLQQAYPDKITISPLNNPITLECILPGSKSITNRALVIAALNSGNKKTHLKGILHSEDTEIMVDCLEKLGFIISVNWKDCTASVSSPKAPGIIPSSNATLFTGNSGTTMRFLTAMVGLGNGTYKLDGIKRMQERPINDLLKALNALNINASSENNNGCPPVIIKTPGWSGGITKINSEMSSQFISGILMAAPFAKGETRIILEGNIVSQSYIGITLAMLKDWGITATKISEREYLIPGYQIGNCFEYQVEPDASAASYFYAAAAITAGKVTTPGLGKNSLQGDIKFVQALELMGAQVTQDHKSTTIIGKELKGISIDMNDISDTVMTLGVVACFAKGTTKITNIGHIRHKETDRISALANELRKIGALVEEYPDSIIIHPSKLYGAEIETYNDHRIAMSFAIAGLKIPGITICNPSCVAKTYPDFFEDLAKAT